MATRQWVGNCLHFISPGMPSYAHKCTEHFTQIKTYTTYTHILITHDYRAVPEGPVWSVAETWLWEMGGAKGGVPE